MSGREYTLEELNYFRVCYITIKVIRDGLQTVFKREWDRVHGSTLGLWQDTAKNGNDFFNLESPRSRRKNNRLLGIIRNSNTSEWDSTSFFFAILFSDSLGALVTPTVATSVDTLRVFRNRFFAHRSQASISETDFQANLKLIWNAFTALHLDTKELHEISSQGSFPTGELQQLQEKICVLEEELQATPESFKCLPPEPSHEVNERKSKVDEIMQMFKNLQKTNDGSIVTVYLHGNPGCGKSQIAREIGKTFYKEAVPDGTEDSFAFAMTLNAESEQSLLESFCKFARKLGVTEYSLNSIAGGDSNLKPDERISHLKTLISAKVKDYFTWLVIFDNANDLESLKSCWPDEDWGGCGKVLVTTQDSINLPFGESSVEDISLSDGMQIEDALTLLRSISRFSCDDENLERLVIEELDFQPLAIACAALYVRHVRTVPGGFTWKDYLRKLKMGKRHETDKIYEKQSRSYQSSMTSAVTIAVQTLVQNERFKHVVHFLGLGAPEPIDLAIIVGLVKKQEPDLDEDVAAADIAQCSLLIRFDEDDRAISLIRVHQVVHDAFRRHLLDNCNTREITALSKIYIETLAPFGQHNVLQIDLEFHMFSKLIAPHLKLFSTYLKTSSSWISPDVTSDERKQLKNAFLNFGDICNIHGHLSAAIKYLEHALDIAKEEGDDDGEIRIKFIATILNNLGIVYCKQGKLREAKDHHERAVSLLKSLTNQNPTPEIADSLNKLGNVCYSLGDFGEAKNWFCQSLAMREELYGRYHTTFAASLNNLGCVSSALGEHDIAKDHYQRSLAIEEEVNGKFHPRVADCLCNLGIVYSELGSTGKAIEYHEQALKMRKELYFPDHFLISESYNNLGLMLKSMGQLEQAMNYYDAALRIRKKVLHDEHPAVAEILNNLGQLYMEMGELEKSEEFHYQALNIRRESLGSDHCKVGDTMHNLGLVREQCFELDDAVFYFEKALEIYSKSYPMSHPLCQTADECLQRVSQQQQDLRAHDLRNARSVLPRTKIPRVVRRPGSAFFGSHWAIRVHHTSANVPDLKQTFFRFVVIVFVLIIQYLQSRSVNQ